MTRTDTITLQDPPEELRICTSQVVEVAPGSPAPPTFKEAKARFEAGYVTELLKKHDYNISQAAKAAAADRKTFYSLLQKHHISSRH